MTSPRPSPHDTPTGLTDPRDAVREWEAERQAMAEHVGTATKPMPATYSRNANAADSFERLGNLLHAIERQLREVVEGTWEEREMCFRRFSSETFEHATKAADAVAEFKRQVFVESERCKELNRENQ